LHLNETTKVTDITQHYKYVALSESNTFFLTKQVVGEKKFLPTLKEKGNTFQASLRKIL